MKRAILLSKIKNPRLVASYIWRHLGGWIPDVPYLKVLFYIHMGKKLDLKNPKTFSEKLQWLKLYDRKSEYVKMVDKYAAKEYVAGIIGDEYIIPTLGVWDRPEYIDWDSLPDKFVLKCTHDSGDLVICKDKSKLDKKAAIKKLNHGLKQNYFKVWREWPYKNVLKRIIAEMFIDPPPEHDDLPDYKFFCFNGEPKYCQVISGRNKEMRIDFFDHDWNHQQFHEPKDFSFAEVEPTKPYNYERMWEMARELAKDKAFSRIDFYDIGSQVYFGEITFYPTGGLGGFAPEDFDKIIGEMIKLPGEKVGG